MKINNILSIDKLTLNKDQSNSFPFKVGDIVRAKIEKIENISGKTFVNLRISNNLLVKAQWNLDIKPQTNKILTLLTKSISNKIEMQIIDRFKLQKLEGEFLKYFFERNSLINSIKTLEKNQNLRLITNPVKLENLDVSNILELLKSSIKNMKQLKNSLNDIFLQKNLSETDYKLANNISNILDSYIIVNKSSQDYLVYPLFLPFNNLNYSEIYLDKEDITKNKKNKFLKKLVLLFDFKDIGKIKAMLLSFEKNFLTVYISVENKDFYKLLNLNKNSLQDKLLRIFKNVEIFVVNEKVEPPQIKFKKGTDIKMVDISI